MHRRYSRRNERNNSKLKNLDLSSKKKKKLRTGAVSSPPSPDATHHSAPVRALAFDATSTRVLSGGDDKAVKVFERKGEEEEEEAEQGGWRLVARWTAAKKVSAACFAGSGCSPSAIAADKFGDVVCGPATAAEALEAAKRPARPLWRGAPEIFAAKKLAPDIGRGQLKRKGGGGGEGTDADDAAAAAAVEEPAASPPPLPLFGHFCTVVTALSLSGDSAALASCDRDGKVRVTRLPRDLSARGGAPEALSFCLGHTAFCTGVQFLGEGERAASPSSCYLFASSSGDGCVRLWGCFADARGGVPLGSALPCSREATEAAQRRAEACRKVAEVVAARRTAKARAAAALPFGGGASGDKKAKKKEDGEEEAKKKEEASGGNDGDGNENGGGEEEEGGGEEEEDEEEDEFAGLDLPSSLTPPPAVVCLAGDRAKTLVAAVEGEPELLVIELGSGSDASTLTTSSPSPSSPSPLRICARVAVPGVTRPTSLALDAHRRIVWAAGVDDGGMMAVGFAKLPAPAPASVDGDGAGNGDGGGSASPLPPAEALRALRDAADAGAVSPPPSQISQDLKRVLVSPRVLKLGK